MGNRSFFNFSLVLKYLKKNLENSFEFKICDYVYHSAHSLEARCSYYNFHTFFIDCLIFVITPASTIRTTVYTNNLLKETYIVPFLVRFLITYPKSSFLVRISNDSLDVIFLRRKLYIDLDCDSEYTKLILDGSMVSPHKKNENNIKKVA